MQHHLLNQSLFTNNLASGGTKTTVNSMQNFTSNLGPQNKNIEDRYRTGNQIKASAGAMSLDQSSRGIPSFGDIAHAANQNMNIFSKNGYERMIGSNHSVKSMNVTNLQGGGSVALIPPRQMQGFRPIQFLKDSIKNLNMQSTSIKNDIDFKIDSKIEGDIQMNENFQDNVLQMTEEADAQKKDVEVSESSQSKTENPKSPKEPKDDDKEEEKSEQEWDLSLAEGAMMEPYEVKVSNNDCILYNLGIGFQKDPMNKSHYKFTYENADDFQSFPVQNVTVAHRTPLDKLKPPGVPDFDVAKILHTEEKVEFFKPLIPERTYVCQEKFLEIQDKKRFSIIVLETIVSDKESGDEISKIITQLFVGGLSGSGNRGTIKSKFPKQPDREPDATSEEVTEKNQAFMYRLNGDLNPIHVDPDISIIGGFETPILHGLCTYGICARAVYEAFHPEDAMKLKLIEGKFTSHVFPGETMIVDMWKEGNQVIFDARTKEREGKTVIKGYCELHE